MKKIVKIITVYSCFICVLPVFLFYKLLRAFSTQKMKTFQGFSQFYSIVPGIFGEYLRREFYRLTLKQCSRDCCISFGTVFSNTEASIGKGVYIGAYCIIGKVKIGKNSLIASRVSVPSGKHQHLFSDLEKTIREQRGSAEVVSIGEDCWIGEGAVVLADVGNKSIVAAGSVVISSVKEYAIVGGNPAKFIGERER